MTEASKLYNVVVLPVTELSAATPLFQLSAGRRDGERRLVSPFWTEAEVRLAMSRSDTPDGRVDQLFLGNRMAYAPRDSRKLFFEEATLLQMGLQDASEIEPAGTTA